MDTKWDHIYIDRACTCKKPITTKTVTILGETDLGLFYNCPHCCSTLVMSPEEVAEQLKRYNTLKGCASLVKKINTALF